MNNLIIAILDQEKQLNTISNMLDEMVNIIGTKTESGIDAYDVVLDYYNIPKDNTREYTNEYDDIVDTDGNCFCRDWFFDKIYECITGDITYEELDNYLNNWDKK